MSWAFPLDEDTTPNSYDALSLWFTQVLENRTKQSKNEMDTMEALTELRELNARHEKVDHESMIKKAALYQKELERLQKEEEDRLIRSVLCLKLLAFLRKEKKA